MVESIQIVNVDTGKVFLLRDLRGTLITPRHIKHGDNVICIRIPQHPDTNPLYYQN